MFSNEELLSITASILKHYQLDPGGIHGIGHWGRVLENGTHLAALTGANLSVVQLFAVFHDCRRVNDDQDPDHGARGAALAGTMNGRLFTLADDELAMLQDACICHAIGFTDADVTIQTCWDADRLDLPRVHVVPTPGKLCTDAAREKAFRDLTREKSLANHLTPFVLELKKRTA